MKKKKRKNQYNERWISKTILNFLYEISENMKNGVGSMSFKSNIYSQKTPNNHNNYSID